MILKSTIFWGGKLCSLMDVSEEHTTPIFKPTFLLLVLWLFPCSTQTSTQKMVAVNSSEMTDNFSHMIQRHFQEYRTLHNNRCESLRSFRVFLTCLLVSLQVKMDRKQLSPPHMFSWSHSFCQKYLNTSNAHYKQLQDGFKGFWRWCIAHGITGVFCGNLQ
jgi:hypothetical protein